MTDNSTTTGLKDRIFKKITPAKIAGVILYFSAMIIITSAINIEKISVRKIDVVQAYIFDKHKKIYADELVSKYINVIDKHGIYIGRAPKAFTSKWKIGDDLYMIKSDSSLSIFNSKTQHWLCPSEMLYILKCVEIDSIQLVNN